MKRFFAMLMVLGLVFAGLHIPDYSVSSESFKPGGSGSVTITVENTELTGSILGVTVNGFATSGLTVSKSNIFLGDLEPGSSTVASIPIKINDNAESGIYLLEVRASGQYRTYEEGVNYKTATIPIKVVNSPIISLSSDKDTIYDVDTFDLIIMNKGGKAKNVRLSVSDGFSLMGTTEIFIDEIDEEATVEITLDSRNANEGAITVPFTIVYENELGDETTVVKSLPVTLKKEKLDLVFTQKSELVTRKDSALKMDIKNNGVALQDVTIEIKTEGLKLREISDIDVGDLAAGATVQIEEKVFPELSPGINKINITIKWMEEGVEKEETKSIPVTITSDADVAVYMDAKPTPLMSGQEHTLSVLVSNLGSYSIDNVEVSVESDSLGSLDVSDAQYIGSLKNDDFSTVQFNVKVKPLPEGEYPIDIKVKYRDASGEWKEKNIETNIMIHGSAGEQDYGMMIVYLVVLVVLIAVIVWYFKLRKKKVLKK